MKAKVTGWKKFKGEIDRGNPIDSGRVFIELPLDDTRGNSKGYCTAEMRLPSSEAIDRIAHLPLPFEAELDVAQVADGKGGFKTVCTDVVPVSQAKPTAVQSKAAA